MIRSRQSYNLILFSINFEIVNDTLQKQIWYIPIPTYQKLGKENRNQRRQNRGLKKKLRTKAKENQ